VIVIAAFAPTVILFPDVVDDPVVVSEVNVYVPAPVSVIVITASPCVTAPVSVHVAAAEMFTACPTEDDVCVIANVPETAHTAEILTPFADAFPAPPTATQDEKLTAPDDECV